MSGGKCDGREGASVPGWRAYWRISSTVWTSLSSGACRTIITEPRRHRAHPTRPMWPSSSWRSREARIALLIIISVTYHRQGIRTYPMSTLSAPRGVTRIAGANAYAAKFATTEWKRVSAHHKQGCVSAYLRRRSLPNTNAAPINTCSMVTNWTH